MTRWLCIAVVGLAALAAPPTARAHPMGNFAVCHYTRLRAEKDTLHIRYILDLAEVPTVGEKRLLDRDGKAAYLAAKEPELLAGLTVEVNGRRAPLGSASGDLQLTPGAAGLDTLRLVLDFAVPLPEGEAAEVVFRDRNYEGRAGWKEIVAVAGPGRILRGASVPAADRSRELTSYPADALPPQDAEARFTALPGLASLASLPVPAEAEPPTSSAGTTPRDAFTEAVAAPDLGPGLVLTGLAIAFAFGALHGLSPGHGKAMVAAYLVGTRGTAGHAAFLGAVVTVTHTAGVFALGVAALVASRYVVPERLYPVLSALAGLVVCGVGLRLLCRRVRRLLRGRPVTAGAHGHHHLPEGPVTARSLLALGVSGGLVPCPSALVVLLAAVALHRIAYGLLLISSFSLGLASVLVAIGLLVVYARRWLDRLPTSAALLRRVPVVSAAVITLIGVGLVVRAVEQGMP